MDAAAFFSLSHSPYYNLVQCGALVL